MPAPLTIPADRQGTATCLVDVKRPKVDTITDACANRIIPVYVDSTAVVNTDGTGSVTYRYRYTDCAGNSSIWKFVYTLTPGQFTPEDNDTTYVHCVSEIHAPTNPVIVNCGDTIKLYGGTNTSTLSNGCGDSTFVYTYTVNGENYMWSYTYRVTPEPFEVPANADTLVMCASDVTRPTPPSVTGCALIVPTFAVQDSTTHGCKDTVVYVYTYEDCVPAHTKTWTYTYYIQDTVKPVITGTLPNQTLTGCSRAVIPAAYTDVHTMVNAVAGLTISDNCVAEADLVLTSQDVVDSACVINVTRTYTVTDRCGNTAQISQHFTVNHADAITVVAETTEKTVNCLSQAKVANVPMPTVKDACENTLTPDTVIIDSTAYSGCQGDLVFNYKYSDCAGHQQTWPFTFHIVPAPLTIPADRQGTATCLVDVKRPKVDTITDACANRIIPVYVDSTAVVNTDGTGSVTYRYRYTDCAGNSSIWKFVYTLTPGQFTPEDNDTTYVHCVSEIHAPTNPVIVNCGDTIKLYGGTNTSTLSNGCGDSTFVYTYTVNGENYTWSYTYRVTPEPFEVPANADTLVMCAADVTRPVPPAVTGCALIVPTFAVQDSTTHGCKDTVVYVYTYEDCVPAHTKTWTYTYYIQDTVKPVITGTLPNQTLTGCSRAVIPAAYTDVHTMVNAVAGLTISDNCVAEADLVLTSQDVVDSACVINVTRTYTVTDRCGNTAQISQHFTVNHADAITVVAETTEKTVNCLSQAKVANVPMPTVKDACENTLTPDTVIIDSTAYSGCQGDLVFNYKYSDCAGHQQMWPFTFHIVPAPLTIPADRQGTATCLVDVHRPKVDTITDVCGNRIIPMYKDSIADVNMTTGTGTVTYHYTYTDCSGNQSVWTFVYTLTPGQFTPEENDTTYVYCVSEITAPTKPIIVNCGDTIDLYDGVNTSTLSGGCGDSTFVYTYTVNGENYTWSYTYRVTPKPFTVPANVVNRVQCIAEVTRPVPPTVTNACQNAIVPTFAVDSTTHGCADTVVYRYTYQDCVPEHTLTWTCTYYVKDTIKPAFTVPANNTICRQLDGSYEADTLAMGGPRNLSDNCVAAADLQVTYSDVVTNHVTSQDTLIRTWTVSDHCNDSVQVQQILINPTYHVDIYQVICEGTDYEFGHLPRNATNVYYDTTASLVTGCDSVTALHLTVNPIYHVTDDSTVCASALPIIWNETQFEAAATKDVTLQTVDGCDSVVTMTLHVNPTYNVTDDSTVCANALPVNWNGVLFAEAGTQTVTLSTLNHCDSIVTMTLHVNPVYQVADDSTICVNDLPITWNGVDFDDAGTKIATLHTANGCDSVVTMTLKVNPVTDSIITVIAYEPYTWHDSTYRETPSEFPTYTIVGGNRFGCDSIVKLDLTVILKTYSDIYDTACESYTWYDSTYTVTPATNPVHVLENANQYGNDSIVTLHLIIYHKSYGDTIATGCYSFTWHDSTYTETPSELPTYTMSGANVHGCDSIVRLHLTVIKPENHYDTVKKCDGLPYTWPRNNETYASTGDYGFAHLDLETGCTHYDSLHLTIGRSDELTIDTFACRSYRWGDSLLIESGIYTKTFTNASGCDSIVHLDLTITDGTEEIYEYDTVTVAQIQAGTVIWRGDTIREPGFHTDTAYAAPGSYQCDTIFHMIITVLCPDFRAHSIPIANVCGNDGVIIVVVDHPADSMKNVDYGINIQGNITWQTDSIFTHVPSGFRAIIVRDTAYQCFTMANVVVPAPTQRTMTCPPPVSIMLNYGDPLPYYISPETLGTPQLTGWRMQFTEITNNIPDGYLFPEGITTIQWVAEDTLSSCELDTCEQVVNITFPGCPDAVDCEGNFYHGVRVGTYCWTQRNLESHRYQNADGSCGDTIPCIYEYSSTLYPNTQQNVDIFGLLYCFEAAVHDSVINENGHIQGICPEGWYLPTPEQYEELNAYGIAALRSQEYWIGGGGTNTTEFTWLPAGFYNGAAQRFEGLYTDGYFWSVRIVNGEVTTVPIYLRYDCDEVRELETHTGLGYSIRCIKE